MPDPRQLLRRLARTLVHALVPATTVSLSLAPTLVPGLAPTLALGLAPTLSRGAALHGQVEVSLEELGGARTAIGVGIIHRAAWDRIYAVGTLDREGTMPVDSATTFRAPALTKVLVAMSARALAASGQLDLDEPIGGVVPDLDPAVGRVTLRQLLHHASGLDDAEPYEGQSWSEAMAVLDEGAFVLPPGEVASRSRYSYPLAARVLEHLARAPLSRIADALILAPLGLDATEVGGTAQLPRYQRDPGADTDAVVELAPRDSVLGLPVTVTSAPDLLALSAAWMDGGIPGSSPIPDALLPPDRRAVDERDGMSRTGSGLGALLSTGSLHWLLVPATGTAAVRWTSGAAPSRTDMRVSNRVVELSGLSLRVPPRGAEPDGPTGWGAAAAEGFTFGATGDWAGAYRNGSVMFELRDVDGRLHIWDGRESNPMRHTGGGVLELDREGYMGASIRLARIDGERVAFYRDLVYRLDGPTGG